MLGVLTMQGSHNLMSPSRPLLSSASTIRWSLSLPPALSCLKISGSVLAQSWLSPGSIHYSYRPRLPVVLAQFHRLTFCASPRKSASNTSNCNKIKIYLECTVHTYGKIVKYSSTLKRSVSQGIEVCSLLHLHSSLYILGIVEISIFPVSQLVS